MQTIVNFFTGLISFVVFIFGLIFSIFALIPTILSSIASMPRMLSMIPAPIVSYYSWVFALLSFFAFWRLKKLVV